VVGKPKIKSTFEMGKRLLVFTIACYACSIAYGQNTDRQAMIDQIKKEILDSLRKSPGLLDKGSTVDSSAPAQADPFTYGDFTWLNGNDRRHQSLIDSKYFTPTLMFDANYNYSNRNPIDHTVVGSTATLSAG
jgi:hypothetical protein